ncbi:MAG: hypothetical protein H0X30_00315 [Anaerolineae bacterium]|nr:hypothetical protein [Anaerolineae bacterium]
MVNGQQLFNNWNNVTSAVFDSGTITLAAGVKYDITLEYYENTSNASVKLEWQSASQTRQVVPSTQLYGPAGQLAFTGHTAGNDDVHVINPDGTGTVAIANSTTADHGGVWSSDGTKIVYKLAIPCLNGKNKT